MKNIKEMLRDPLTACFGAGFPLVLLGMFSLIQKNIPVPLFEIEVITPGIVCFGFSFLALFSALQVSKDRSSALMTRLLASPLAAKDYIMGYALPMLPLAIVQEVICFGFAAVLGLKINGNALLCMAVMLPAAIVYIAIGLICGSLLNDKQVGGVCGAALTNVSALLSGAWFDIAHMGRGMDIFAHILPFANAVDAGRAAIAGDFSAMAQPMTIVCAYAVILGAAAIIIFALRMRRA
ncbi:MAG: ABC transporter permease [Clostridia bacterium]|nr:ABC transporter permease [Clostridia bacterium]